MEPTHESLSLDIVSHEISKHLPISTLRKLCHTCKPIRSQVFRHGIRKFTVDSEISLKFVYENRKELSLRSLSILSLPASASFAVSNSVNVLVEMLASQSRLEELTLNVSTSTLSFFYKQILTVAAAPPCESLSSLYVRGSFSQVLTVPLIVERYPNLERLVFIEQIYRPPIAEASLLAKLTKLRYLQVSNTEAEIFSKYKRLSHLTTFITNVQWKPMINYPNTIAAISSMKDIAPEGVGVNLIFVGPMCLLWDLIQTPKIVETSNLRAVLDAGASVSLEYMDEKVNPILCHLVQYRSESPTFLEWLQMLLDAGADPTASGKGGQNALLAILNTNTSLETIKQFYKCCLDKWRHLASFSRLFCTYPEDLTIFHVLSMSTHPNEELLAYFVSKEGLELLGNPSLDVTDSAGRTAAVAAYSGESLDILLKAGADPNTRTPRGLSLICYKAASGPTSSVSILLRHPDLILPPPVPEAPFQDVLEACYWLNLPERYNQLLAISHWTQLVKLMDKMAKDLRYVVLKKDNTWRIDQLLETFSLAASAAVDRHEKGQSVYRDSAVYIWDIFECKLTQPKYFSLIEALLLSGIPLSWPHPSAKSNRKKSNVIIRACELKAYSILPLVIKYDSIY